MKIDINKKYAYRNGEPARILCVDAPYTTGPFYYPVVSLRQNGTTVHHQDNGLTPETDLDLIEAKPEPRLIDKFREALDSMSDEQIVSAFAEMGCEVSIYRSKQSVPEPAIPEGFPPVGARLRFTKIPFAGIKYIQKVGDEITVEEVTTDGFEAGGWRFGKDWQDGLELVTEPETPEGFPPVPETPITDSEEIARLKSATVDKDPTPPVRGFFIHGRGTESSRDGYLTNKGTWTHGCTASDNGNFWPTKEEAEAFLAKMRSRIVEPTSSYPPPESEWRELGPDDGVFLSDDEVSAKENGPDEGWLTADRVSLTGRRIGDNRGLRARRRVSAEEAKAKAALEPEKTDPYDALKEAEAGLEVAIAIIAKELPGWDWQKSSPRLALEIVKKALAENGGEDE